MMFWDSSALVPLIVEQEHSESLRRLIPAVSGMFTWWGTKIECISALMRLSRDGFLSEPEAEQAVRLLENLARGFIEVQPSEDVRRTSVRLLRVHPLRAVDSLQLASALVACQHRPAKMSFVCLDGRLRTAANREGFQVLPDSMVK